MEDLMTFYWYYIKSKRILILIAPFGFGTRTAAETLIKQLGLECGSWEHSAQLGDEILGQAKVLFNFGVVGFNDKEKFEGYKIWIDCIFWIRNYYPAFLKDYDLVCSESFFELRNNIKTVHKNVKEIQPLLEIPGKRPDEETLKTGYVLLSLGGIETPFTTDILRYHIPEMIVKSLIEANVNVKTEIIGCFPEKTRRYLSKKLGDNDLIMLTDTDRNNYLQLLSNAKCAIIQPGLYGPFEAFKIAVPTIFTPPFSYTQLLQAKKFDELNLLGEVPFWSDLKNRSQGYTGNVEEEEPACALFLSAYYERIMSHNNKDLKEWAVSILDDSSIRKISTLTQEREKSTASNPNYFDYLLFLREKILKLV